MMIEQTNFVRSYVFLLDHMIDDRPYKWPWIISPQKMCLNMSTRPRLTIGIFRYAIQANILLTIDSKELCYVKHIDWRVSYSAQVCLGPSKNYVTARGGRGFTILSHIVTLWCLINVPPPRLLIWGNFCFSNYKIFKSILSRRCVLTNFSVPELYWRRKRMNKLRYRH